MDEAGIDKTVRRPLGTCKARQTQRQGSFPGGGQELRQTVCHMPFIPEIRACVQREAESAFRPACSFCERGDTPPRFGVGRRAPLPAVTFEMTSKPKPVFWVSNASFAKVPASAENLHLGSFSKFFASKGSARTFLELGDPLSGGARSIVRSTHPSYSAILLFFRFQPRALARRQSYQLIPTTVSRNYLESRTSGSRCGGACLLTSLQLSASSSLERTSRNSSAEPSEHKWPRGSISTSALLCEAPRQYHFSKVRRDSCLDPTF